LAVIPRRFNFPTVNGKRLETLLHEPVGANATVVMLHEGLGSIAMWKDFPERVAEATGCGVLVYSRYGHGKSERLAEKRSVDFMHHEAKVVLPELLRQFEIERPILLGHSDGASIALIYAGTWPIQVRALILEAPHVFVEDLGIRSISAIRKLYEASDLPKNLARYHDHADETFRGWNDIWLDPQFSDWNIEEYLAAISCPTLVIQGEDDEYGTLAQVEAIQRRVPATQLLSLLSFGSPSEAQVQGAAVMGMSLAKHGAITFKDGKVQQRNLDRELITLAELTAAAHKQGLRNLEDVDRGVLETGGSITFIPKDPSPTQTHYEDLVKRLDAINRQLRALQPARSDGQ